MIPVPGKAFPDERDYLGSMDTPLLSPKPHPSASDDGTDDATNAEAAVTLAVSGPLSLSSPTMHKEKSGPGSRSGIQSMTGMSSGVATARG